MVQRDLKIVKIGNSLGWILPKDILTALNVAKGDSLYFVVKRDGVYLTPYDPELEVQMNIARKALRKKLRARSKRRRR